MWQQQPAIPIEIQLLSDDDDHINNNTNNNNNNNTPIPNPNKRSRSSVVGDGDGDDDDDDDLLIISLDDDDDDPTPPPPSKVRKSFNSNSNLSTPFTVIIPETPLSQMPKPRVVPISSSSPPPPSFPGKVEKDSVDGTCLKNLGTRSGFHGEKDLEPVFSTEKNKKNKFNDGELQKWLDIDSMCYLHTALPSNVRSMNGDVGKISSLKDVGSSADSCLEYDSEKSRDFGVKNCQEKKVVSADIDVECLDETTFIVHSSSESGRLQSTKTHHPYDFQENAIQVQQLPDQDFDKENYGLKSDYKAIGKEQNKEQPANKNKAKEDRLRLMEEKKQKKEQEKSQKAALRAEAAKLKELEKEKKKLEKFKFSEKDILAKIDTKVIQLGKIGGHLVTKFGDKNLKFDLTSNLVEKTIIWRMTVPEGTSQPSSQTTEIPYIVLIYEAEEFCKIVNDGSLFNHISSVQTHYPDYTVCCLTNRLMSYINRRENDKYKNRKDASDWKRPPVEQVFAKLTTQFANVHTRQCADEAELAEHVVGLTSNLAKCHSRKKLTHLSVNANGSNVPKDCSDRRLIMKHPWLKALVSIPKVQPRFAIAIWKKYPNLKSLLSVYLDPTKSVHEKEFLLKDLQVEDILGNGDRRLGELCSKRVYRILMAQNGCIKTDDAEYGADVFMQQT